MQGQLSRTLDLNLRAAPRLRGVPRLGRPPRRLTIGVLAIATLIAVWQSLTLLNLVPLSFVSSPVQVASVGAAMLRSGELLPHLGVSAVEFAGGLGLAVLVGIPIGLAIACSRRLRYLLDPPIMAMYSTPRISLLPILVIWLGIGMEPKILVAFLGAVFPILVNTEAGIKQVDPVWIRAVRSLGAGPLQITFKVLLPGALPAILGGIRLGAGRAMLGVIAAELYLSTAGLGFLLQGYGNAGRTAEVMVLGLTVALLGYACVAALETIEARVGTWRRTLAQ